ncbi:MAG: hypothetical protein L0099_15645 [Acidobacteria bacterium]|nr:hypothetical protein [Acidobacteriota bacterium]
MREDHHPPVTVRPYHSYVYDVLNPFRAAKLLLKKNQHLLEKLGDVIVHHNLHERYGISLLHKHFELLRDEILLRGIDRNRRVAHIRPVPRHLGTVPYLWRAQIGIGGQWHFFPLEFLEAPSEPDRESSDLSKVDTFLADVAEALARLDLLDVFGIATSNILSIPLDEDEILVESTDAEKRLLTIQAEHRADLNVSELTETFWTFTPAETFVKLGQVMEVCRRALLLSLPQSLRSALPGALPSTLPVASSRNSTGTRPAG